MILLLSMVPETGHWPGEVNSGFSHLSAAQRIGRKSALSGASLHLPLLVAPGPLPVFSAGGFIEVTCLLRALRYR